MQTTTTKTGDVATFTNAADGVEARVYAAANGEFRVIVKDLDSGMTLPMIKCFRVLPDAVAYAQKVAA